MKKFLLIFLLMQLLLFGYIFDTSIYNIYEKNNIGNSSLNGYIIDYATGEDILKVYSQIDETYPNAVFELRKYRVGSSDNAVYRIYTNSPSPSAEPQAISKDISFEYFELRDTDILDSSGVFYTNLHISAIRQIESITGISINEYQDDIISYSLIVTYNLYNFILLFVITQVIYFIFSSSNLKEISAKKLFGYSNTRIVLGMMRPVVNYSIAISAVILTLRFISLVIPGRLNADYVMLSVFYCMVVILINALQMLITTIVIRHISIDEMLKNRTFLKHQSLAINIVKFTILIAVTMTVSTLMTTIDEYAEAESNVLALSDLSDYYSAYGFYSVEYERALGDLSALEEYSLQAKAMYNKNDSAGLAYLCDTRQLESYLFSSFLQRQGIEVDELYTEYSLNSIVANENFLAETHLAAYIGQAPSTPYILVPSMYQHSEAEVKELYVSYYNSLIKYDAFYGINSDVLEISDICIIYIPDNVEIDVLTSMGYIKIRNSIIVVDNGTFSGIYYLDNLSNAHSLYFSYASRDVLSAELFKYGLSGLLIPATLITPFAGQLESVEFVLNMLAVFISLFIVTLLFIVFSSNMTDIMSHRKAYAVKSIMGFSIYRILMRQLVMDFALAIIGIILQMLLGINASALVLFIIIDMVVLISLYRIHILNKLADLQKGE